MSNRAITEDQRCTPRVHRPGLRLRLRLIWRGLLLALAVATLCLPLAGAQAAPCRSVEVHFKPAGNLQLAVWAEDSTGRFVDTLFVTRATGVFGIANRPGTALLKSDFRWPYGRRDMVLPIWAHRRARPYRLVVMGGAAGNSPPSCGVGGIPSTECDDTTIGYHFHVSSKEPYFCSPTGGITKPGPGGVDVVSCASPFYGSKGAYADAPALSLYPPRGDLSVFEAHDSADARRFAGDNDLVAISGATPPANVTLSPAIRWQPAADGDYTIWVEANLENDRNLLHDHPATADAHVELLAYGKIESYGQPSVVYRVPIRVGSGDDAAATDRYEGYGDWDGATGTLHPPDLTISEDTPGSGASRLQLDADASGAFRVRVEAHSDCNLPGSPEEPSCTGPDAPTDLSASVGASTVELSFASASTGRPSMRFDVRYRESAEITDEGFDSALPSSTPPPAPGAMGSRVTTLLSGLRPDTTYSVAVRALSDCAGTSPSVVTMVHTAPAKYATLSGCFLATAAFGSPMAAQLHVLRTLRDRVLLARGNHLGALAVAAYYSLSPSIAAALSTDERLRAGARAVLSPLVTALSRRFEWSIREPSRPLPSPASFATMAAPRCAVR